MLYKHWINTTLVLSLLTGTAMAQDFTYQATPLSSGVAQTGYVVEVDDDDASVEDLEELLERYELRLRELENDVEDRLKDIDEDSDDADESNDDLLKRIDYLEATIEKQEDSIGKFQDTLPQLAYHGHKNPRMQVFGRIHLDYWAFPRADDELFPLEANASNPGGNPQDRVAFRRMRIGVKGDLFDNMFYKYEGEFAGGNSPSYRDAYFGFKDVPYLNTVIIGNHKRPYGLDHLNSSRNNIFIERPFIVEAFNQDNRRIGVSTNGVSQDQNMNWRFGVWNQELTQNGAGWITDDYQLEVAGRIAGTPWYDESSGGRGYLHLGLSGSVGEVNPDSNASQWRTRPEARSSGRWLDTNRIANADETALVGVEALLNVGAFQLSGEYMRLNVDRRGIDANLEYDGGYVQASYFLTGEHMPWNRQRGTVGRVIPFENFFLVRDCDCQTKRGWGAWQAAARVSWADLSDQDVLGGEGESLTLALNWLFNPYSRMQFNYITGQVSNNAGLTGGPAVNGDYDIIGVRMMVDF